MTAPSTPLIRRQFLILLVGLVIDAVICGVLRARGATGHHQMVVGVTLAAITYVLTVVASLGSGRRQRRQRRRRRR